MSVIGSAVGVAALIGGGASVAGGLIAKSGATSASKTQAEAADKATSETKRQYEQNRTDLAPYRAAGELSLANLQTLLGLGTDTTNPQFGALTKETPLFTAPDYRSFLKDPIVQARLSEGSKQVEASAAARAGVLSGEAVKRLSDYGQTFASDELNNLFNREMAAYRTNTDVASMDKNNLFNKLQVLAGMGESAAGQTAQLGSVASGQISNNILSAGNAISAGQVAGGNILGSTIANAGTTLADILVNSRKSSYSI